jgi:4-amino-4-deoxy-L-arabinose transferase-like glycosyltransferase
MTICSFIEIKFEGLSLPVPEAFGETKMFPSCGIFITTAQMPDKLRRWIAVHPNWTLTLLALAVLVPFLNKPFNMDDPLFVWTAQQIHNHPGNPYGFDVNWYGQSEPMWQVTKNPPLAGYYLAVAGTVFGWSEIAMHFALLFPALGVILGTYRLARRFCDHPMLAASVTLFMPVFLVSSSTVMCDVLMLAFWVWAVELWMGGLKREYSHGLTVAALLIGLAAIAKYYGACLVPLLGLYSLIDQRRLGWWAVRLLIPLAILYFYQLATVLLYGQPLFASATDYAVGKKAISLIWGFKVGSVSLAFTGGCLALVIFFAPVFWRMGTLLKFVGIAVLFVAVFIWKDDGLKDIGPATGVWRKLMELQIIFWAVGGVCALALAGADVWRQCDSRSWLLVLWVFGTFLFTACLNWIVNGRSILPMAPAMGILIARRCEQVVLNGGKDSRLRELYGKFAFAAGAALALLVARSDMVLAKAVRESAQQVCAKYGHGTQKLWFLGHWGFQYYMEALGASAFGSRQLEFKPDDLLAVPFNNTNNGPPENVSLVRGETFVIQGPRLLTLTHEEVGAGFYASVLGPLPFAFGDMPPEKVLICILNPTPVPASSKN